MKLFKKLCAFALVLLAFFGLASCSERSTNDSTTNKVNLSATGTSTEARAQTSPWYDLVNLENKNIYNYIYWDIYNESAFDTVVNGALLDAIINNTDFTYDTIIGTSFKLRTYIFLTDYTQGLEDDFYIDMSAKYIKVENKIQLDYLYVDVCNRIDTCNVLDIMFEDDNGSYIYTETGSTITVDYIGTSEPDFDKTNIMYMSFRNGRAMWSMAVPNGETNEAIYMAKRPWEETNDFDIAFIELLDTISVLSNSSTRPTSSSSEKKETENIDDVIAGKTDPGNGYYFYDLLVNRSFNWNSREAYEVYYDADEQGYIYVNEWNIPTTITFKKGKIYLILGKYYDDFDSASNNAIASTFPNGLTYNYDDPNFLLLKFYCTTWNEVHSKTEWLYVDDESNWRYSTDCDGDCDCAYCQIDTNYYTKNREIFGGWNEYLGKNKLCVVPTIDFTLTLKESSLNAYPGAELVIISGDVRPLGNADTTAPSIEGDNIYINVDSPLSFEQLKSRFTAHDETDGDITDRLEFTDNTYILTNGKIACGTYSFKVSVSDNAGNTTTELKYVHVVDYTDPVIAGKTINVSYKKQLSESEKRALFTYSDNYTSNDQLLFRWVADTYSSNYSNLGTYTLIAKIIDQQGNEAQASSIINVIDDVAPFLVVPENLKITTLSNFKLDDFRTYITATDEKDGNITDFELTDLDGYLNDTKKAGTYRIKVVASDSADNDIEKIFPFVVEDKDMPTITFDPDYVMVVKKGDKITKEQVINYFVRTGQLTLTESLTVEVASLYFEEVSESAGFYTLRLMNDYKVIETKLEVVDTISTSEDPTTPNTPKPPVKDNKFFSTEGYAENLFHASVWSIYHYITLIGIIIVLVIIIFVWWKKKH